MKRSLRFAAVFAFVCAIAISIPYFSVGASDKPMWITIDHAELEAVMKDMPNANEKIEVITIDAGIAVAKIDDSDIDYLTSDMHKKFHKCAGFIAHRSQTEAFIEVSKNLAVNPNRNFVGSYTIDNQDNVGQMISETSESAIRQMIIDLSSYETRRHNSESGLLSANYINFKWGQLANQRDDMSVSFFNHPSSLTPQPSVILTITGTENPEEIVVLGGHQDSIVGSNPNNLAPGADDDASGIASLTDAIRVIVETGFRPKKTVQFMAYAAEEVGLRGSNDIAETYEAENRNVVGVLQLDMTNHKGVSTVDVGIITDFTNAPQNQFVRDLIAEYLPDLNVVNTACNYGCSDHASWHGSNFPASFPFESTFQGANPEIHTPDDTLENSGGDATHAEKFSKIAIAFIGELAKGSIASQGGNVKYDFDGDQKSDISVYRRDQGEWWYLRSSDNDDRAFAFGNSTDIATPADFTGDGIADIAFWRPSNGEWFVLRSDNTGFYSFPFGATDDIPAPGDFDGDGTADAAVFRPSAGNFFILRSSDGNTDFVPFGASDDKPLIGDYDGDGSDDVAIYRPSVAQFWMLRSTAGLIAYQFGTPGDKAFTADFSGDGTADIGVFRDATAEWLILRSEDAGFFGFPFGTTGDIPAPADYDGDGTADATVFRPSDTTWYSLQSTNGAVFTPFGAASDEPVANSFVVE